MNKFSRLAREAFFVLWFYENPWVYYADRLGVLGDKKVLIKLRNGIKYKINTNTTDIRVLNELWNVGVYDRLLPHIKDKALVIDIGANIGVFSVKAARQASNVKVLSFEPMANNFETLNENIRINNLSDSVFPHKFAISDKAGESILFIHRHDSGGGSLLPHGDKESMEKVKIQCITLEDVFKENKIEKCDFLKIDCEGMEANILMSLPGYIFHKISNITLEWHATLNKISIDELMKFLFNMGYKSDFDSRTGTLYASREKQN